MSRWTEYYTELYNHPVTEDTAVLNAINENIELRPPYPPTYTLPTEFSQTSY